MTLTSTATVATDRGSRYGKQLASHLGRRLDTSWDDASGSGNVPFGDGGCRLTATEHALVLEAEAEDLEQLERLEDVIARHLVRFGARDELVATWVRSDGSEGRTFRHTDEPAEDHRRPD